MALPNNSTDLRIDAKNGEVCMNNQKVFTVRKAPISLHKRLILCDDRGNPKYTLYKKITTMHERWEVYNGDNTNARDLVFSVMRKSMVQWGIIELKVFPANNTTENVCGCMIYAGLFKRSCTILSLGSSTVMAKMKKNSGGNYEVKVHPNFIHYLAFIATLIIILDKISHIDEVSRTTLKIVRMMMDPFDISGLVLEEFGETIAETIMELLVEKITENNNNGTN